MLISLQTWLGLLVSLWLLFMVVLSNSCSRFTELAASLKASSLFIPLRFISAGDAAEEWAIISHQMKREDSPRNQSKSAEPWQPDTITSYYGLSTTQNPCSGFSACRIVVTAFCLHSTQWAKKGEFYFHSGFFCLQWAILCVEKEGVQSDSDNFCQ